MTKRSILKRQGWGFLVTYLGRQLGGTLTHAQGIADADNAAALAHEAGFPRLTTIFLDIETGGLLPARSSPTSSPGSAGVAQAHRLPPGRVLQLRVGRADHGGGRGWRAAGDLGLRHQRAAVAGRRGPARPRPGRCRCAVATTWQYAQNCHDQTHGGVAISPVDLDTSISTNPSNG